MFEPRDLLAVAVGDAERAGVAAAAPAGVAALADGDEVADRVAAESFAAVVVGHGPPAVDAVEVAARVRDADATVPVVVVADGDEGLAADAVAAGADRYVPRERGPDALRTAVEEAIATGERRRERELESEILSEILRKAPLEIYVKDTDLRHVRSTKTILRGDVVGERSAEFLDDHRSEVIEGEDRALLASEESVEEVLSRYEVDATTVDDHDAGWIRSWKYPWYDAEGDLRGLVGFTQDVTGVVETQQELRRKNDLLSKFASVVTHDLRNPLNVAQGTSNSRARSPRRAFSTRSTAR